MALTRINRLGAIALCLSSFVLCLERSSALAQLTAIQFFTLPNQMIWLQVSQISRKSRATPIKLWATYYHIHQAQAVAEGEPLLDPAGRSLGVVLSHPDWCHAALEGTVQVQAAGTATLYNFAGRGATPQTNCAAYFKSLSPAVLSQVNRVRFVASFSPYGYGTQQLKLVPYRTIAVDRSVIPIGSVVFIPAARGQVVMLPSGDRVYHDGFFYAADVGSNIKGNHIDVFLGTHPRNPFPFVTSDAKQPFAAFIIQDGEIAQALARLHQ